MAKVAPAALGLTPKSWANAVSDAKAALALFGIVERGPRRRTPLSPLWADLWAAVAAQGDPRLTTALGRFVQFLDRCGMAPEAVTAAHLDLYREALARAAITPRCWTV
ncbi:MAG: hypothetical protein R6V44_16445 [Paracoccaceae bacterium]